MRLFCLSAACLWLAASCAGSEGQEWAVDSGEVEVLYEAQAGGGAERAPLTTTVRLEPGRVAVERTPAEEVDAAIGEDSGGDVPEPSDPPADTSADSGSDAETVERDSGADAFVEHDAAADSGPDSSQGLDAGTDSSLPGDSGDTDSGQAADSSTADSAAGDSGQDADSTVPVDSSTGEDGSQGQDSGQAECSVTTCDPIGDAGTQRERQSFASVETLECSNGEDTWPEERVCDLDEMCQFIGGTWDCKPCPYSDGALTSLVYDPDGEAEQVIDCYGCRCSSWWLSSGPGCPGIFPVTLDFVPAQVEPGIGVEFAVRVSAAGGMELFPDPEGGSTVESFGMVSFEKEGTSATFEFWVTGKVYVAGSWVKYLATARFHKSCV